MLDIENRQPSDTRRRVRWTEQRGDSLWLCTTVVSSVTEFWRRYPRAFNVQVKWFFPGSLGSPIPRGNGYMMKGPNFQTAGYNTTEPGWFAIEPPDMLYSDHEKDSSTDNSSRSPDPGYSQRVLVVPVPSHS